MFTSWHADVYWAADIAVAVTRVPRVQRTRHRGVDRFDAVRASPYRGFHGTDGPNGLP
jgi:hypothetical protein